MPKAFKYRIYPTVRQGEQLDRSLELLRYFYNAALRERRDAWQINQVRVGVYDQNAQIPAIREADSDYKAITRRTMTQVLRQLDKAFTAFFRRLKNGEKPGYPRFKGKNFFNSIIYNRTGFRFQNGKLKVSGIGELKIKKSREYEGCIKEVRLKREGGKWFAVLFCDGNFANPFSPTGNAVGIDVGIESFATLSDGTQINNPRYHQTAQRKLRIAQRRVARRKKGSNRRRRAVIQLRAIHQKVFNQRHDFQHKLSTDLVLRNDLIVVEKLNMTGLIRGWLSKQVSDARWSGFTTLLTYKAANAGRQFIAVSPKFTSQDCSSCGTRDKKPLGVRVYACSNCGLSLNRDVNAALNILAVGRAAQAST